MSEVPSDSAETRSLLDKAQAGDRQAFDLLFGTHRAHLRNMVDLRLDPNIRARVDASDVVQETNLEAFRRLDSYLRQRTMPFRLWLRQIALDCTLKARRRHVGTARRAAEREVSLPERSSLLLAQQLVSAGPTASQILDRRQLARRLRQAVAQLPEGDREVVLMRHFEGLSNQEVGCLLGIEPGAVSKRHGRAMLRLHRILFESGLTESQL